MSRTRMAERNPESRGETFFFFLVCVCWQTWRAAQTRIFLGNRMKGGNKWFDYVDRSIDVLNSTRRRKKTTVEQIFFGKDFSFFFFCCRERSGRQSHSYLLLSSGCFFFHSSFSHSFSLIWIFTLFWMYRGFRSGLCVCLCAAARRERGATENENKKKLWNIIPTFHYGVVYKRTDGSVRPAAKT